VEPETELGSPLIILVLNADIIDTSSTVLSMTEMVHTTSFQCPALFQADALKPQHFRMCEDHVFI